MHTFWKFQGACLLVLMLLLLLFFHVFHHIVFSSSYRRNKDAENWYKKVIKISMTPKIHSRTLSHLATKLAIYFFKMIVLTDFSLNKDSIKHPLYSWSSHKIIRSSHFLLVAIIIVIFFMSSTIWLQILFLVSSKKYCKCCGWYVIKADGTINEFELNIDKRQHYHSSITSHNQTSTPQTSTLPELFSIHFSVNSIQSHSISTPRLDYRTILQYYSYKIMNTIHAVIMECYTRIRKKKCIKC